MTVFIKPESLCLCICVGMCVHVCECTCASVLCVVCVCVCVCACVFVSVYERLEGGLKDMREVQCTRAIQDADRRIHTLVMYNYRHLVEVWS